MLFNKKNDYELTITGFDSAGDCADFMLGRIVGIIMGVTNFTSAKSASGIGVDENNVLHWRFAATKREAERINQIIDGSFAYKGMKVEIKTR